MAVTTEQHSQLRSYLAMRGITLVAGVYETKKAGIAKIRSPAEPELRFDQFPRQK